MLELGPTCGLMRDLLNYGGGGFGGRRNDENVTKEIRGMAWDLTARSTDDGYVQSRRLG